MDKENWQILWSSETRILYAKGIISKRIVNIGQSESWQEAKVLADRVQSEPEIYLGIEKK